jgi:ferredoxin
VLVWLSVTAEGEQVLVAYDTEAHTELLRTPSVEPPDWPEKPTAVLDRTACTVCAACGEACLLDLRRVRYDLTTGQPTMVSFKRSQAVMRRQPRALVVGDAFASGTALEGRGVIFLRDGSQLAAALNLGEWAPGRGRKMQAFTADGGRPIHLRLPRSLADVRMIQVARRGVPGRHWELGWPTVWSVRQLTLLREDTRHKVVVMRLTLVY